MHMKVVQLSHLTTDVNRILIYTVQSAKAQAHDTVYNTMMYILKKEKCRSCVFFSISIKIYFNILSSTVLSDVTLVNFPQQQNFNINSQMPATDFLLHGKNSSVASTYNFGRPRVIEIDIC